MRILFDYLSRHKGLVALILLLASLNVVFSLLDPMIIGHAINQYVTKASNFSSDEYLQGILLFVGLAVGAAMMSRIAKNFQDYFLSVVTQKVGTAIYTDGIRHTLSLSYDVFEDQRSGETLGRLQKIRQDSEKLIAATVNTVFTFVVGLVFVMIVAVRIYWPIAPIYLATIPLLAVINLVLSRKIKQVQKSVVGQTTALAGATTESLRNIELVKSLGLTHQEINRLNLNVKKILQLELKKVKYIRSLGFVQGTTINLLRNAVVTVLFWLIFRGKLQMGDYFQLFFYSFFLFNPLYELGNIIQQYREAQVSLSNFKDILSTPQEQKPEQPQSIGPIREISFRQVGFKHRTANKPALQGVDFSAHAGQTVAFAGPSGSGKTTLVKLLLGLYRPGEGTISYNGTDSRNIDIDELRRQLGLVTQDSQLFSGTIRDNLLFVKPNATEAEMLEVLDRAACHNLMSRAENGLDSTIGEGGIKISGGEKQRLSIARALLREPRLLVFDEATSALDSLTEEQISQTIRSLSSAGEHITILIAHRLSTIMHADVIYVLEKGKVIESGRHEALLELKGLYYAMWRQQVGEQQEV